MTDSKLSLEEELSLTEFFTDEIGTNVSTSENDNAAEMSDQSSTSAGCMEPDPMSDDPEWKGISMEQIYKHHGPFQWEHLPPIQPSASHSILFKLPLPNRSPPEAHPSQPVDIWHQNVVRMPQSAHSLYPIDPKNEKSSGFRRRWEVIQEALLQHFVSSQQLETAILSYNHKYAERWDFVALHNFFNQYIEEEEKEMCLITLIPKIIQLALQLPNLITGPIPLLKRYKNKAVSMSQLQIASLLANAFLCTFPRRNSTNPQAEYGTYPDINFNRLFGSFREDKGERNSCVMEKLKCIFHYFRRVTSKAPTGIITIQRKYIPYRDCPRWDEQHMKLPSLHITSKGTIECEGAGLLQVDFANKFIGGGVLNYGCVQEEIRFVICPELLVTRLITEVLDDTEALIICGVERYSEYEGYSNSFKWVGDFIDETPRDSSGRLKTCIVAIDALRFQQTNTQYSMGNVIRELNKAYVGFSSEVVSNNLPAVATGNWGCGAFHGNPQLKVLIQLMAAAVAGRSMIYFTFGDTKLRDSIADMYWHLVRHDIDIARLFSLISQYQEETKINTKRKKRSDFYPFLYNRSKIKSISGYFTSNNKRSPKKSNVENKKVNDDKPRLSLDPKKHTSFAKLKEDELEDKIEEWLENVDHNTDTKISNEKVEVKNQEEVRIQIEQEKSDKKKQTFEELFGEKTYHSSPKKTGSALDTFDKLLQEETKIEDTSRSNTSMNTNEKIERKDDKHYETKSESMRVNSKIQSQNNKKESQTKIHDFFKKKT